VLNVGAGSGSYEPAQTDEALCAAESATFTDEALCAAESATFTDEALCAAESATFTVLAVEPSAVMIAQRPPGSAPVVRATAEALPIVDDAVDAAMAVLTIHHWRNLPAGIAQLRRVARRRIVVFTWDQRVTREFWLLREYLPEAIVLDDRRAVPVARVAELLGGARIETVPVPHDCVDGFGAAYWRRPEAYLDPRGRAGMSMLAQTGEEVLAPGLARLAEDIASGRWHERNADLLALDEYDAGYRLLVAEL
jgi:SAM-dependent methyltransferase